MTTVQAAVAAVAQVLRDAVPEPGREARRIVAARLGVEAARMTLHAGDDIAPDLRDLALADAARRAAGEPLSHILGHRIFYGRHFAVDRRVLDPRPETEELVALALSAPFSSLLDLGTGSGAIALTLLAERPDARGVATDLSPDALAVAEGNAAALGLADRVAFRQGSWFEAVEGRFDLIVSNPPYIAAQEMPGLQRELLHEPRMALTDEADGLTAYRAIAAGAAAHLAPGGRLLVEIGPTQGAAVAALFRAAGLAEVEVHPDLDGRDRVVAAKSR